MLSLKIKKLQKFALSDQQRFCSDLWCATTIARMLLSHRAALFADANGGGVGEAAKEEHAKHLGERI